MNEKLRYYQGFATPSERPIVILFFYYYFQGFSTPSERPIVILFFYYYYYFFSFSGHMLVEHSEETVGSRKKLILYSGRNQQCHGNKPLSTSGSGTSGLQKIIHGYPIRSKNFLIFDQNFMKLWIPIVDTQTSMLHYERKLPALTVFELFSFKLI